MKCNCGWEGDNPEMVVVAAKEIMTPDGNDFEFEREPFCPYCGTHIEVSKCP